MPEVETDGINTRHLAWLRALARTSDLLALLLILVTSVLFSLAPLYFIVLSLLLITMLVVMIRDNYAGRTKIAHSTLVTVLLGASIGLLQLSPIPTLAILLISTFTAVSLPAFYQILLGMVFFISAVSVFFIGHHTLQLEQLDNTLLDVVSVFALFFSLSAKYYYVENKYLVTSDGLSRSRLRFNHFLKVANKLARYTPSQVWTAIVQEDKEVRLENKRRKLTVFFSDIKGFTDLSESLSAEDLTSFLNDYFEAMAAVAKRHGATIDKFIGDALMVFFGDPKTKGEREDALACIEMAIDMRREISRLRTHWGALGFEGLDVRMGINTGYCHVGNFGSPTRLSYTAIGREVNLAARIQSAAQPNEILISPNTYELIRHNYHCSKGFPVTLKGFAEPVQVWSVQSMRQGEDQRKARWIEHDLPGFNLHLNMTNIQPVDKVRIRHMLREATLTLDERIREDED